MDHEDPCSDRVDDHLVSRFDDLKTLWDLHQKDPDAHDVDVGNLYEYGLEFSYTAPGTFDGQTEGYWCYLLSFGGPSEEIRFFASGPDQPLYRAEFWLLDWFDGAKRALVGDHKLLADELWQWFQDGGTTQHMWDRAQDHHEI